MKKLLFALCIVLAFCLCACTVAAPAPTTGPASQPTEPLTTPPTTQPDPKPTESTAPETLPPTTLPQETEPATTPPPTIPVPEPKDEDFVRIRDYLPEICMDLRYATENNFTGQVIYEFSEPWLRYGTVKKLMAVQESLARQGLYLKIWDAFRPTAAQFKLWEVYPDSTYVSNPLTGYSSHSRGNTLDLTLVDADGNEITMPTEFDHFSKLADRDYSDCTPEAAANALLLENTMRDCGFKPYSGEWWHFTDTQRYPVEKEFQPVEESWYYAHCREYINLRTEPSSAAKALLQIPVNHRFLVLAWDGNFALVEYQGILGYVHGSYILPVEPDA